MTGKQFVDSNILIYSHDADAGERQRRAAKVLATERCLRPSRVKWYATTLIGLSLRSRRQR